MLRRRAAALAASLCLCLIGLASPASAHYVYESGYTHYTSSEQCVKTRSEISHGSGGGYSKTDNKSLVGQWTPWGIVPCGGGADVPPGWMKNAFVLYKWTGSGWGACRGTQWWYNPIRTSNWTIYANYGTSPPCGRGYYGTMSYTYVWANSAWIGGLMWSGHQYL